MNAIIKAALENTVLCRGTHSAKESYEYAERMEAMIKTELVRRLEEIKDNPEAIRNLIKELSA